MEENDFDSYTKADLLIMINKLETRVVELEKRQKKFNERFLSALSDLTNYVAKWKHPVSRIVVTLSIVLSTIINQLPYIISLFH